MVLSSTNLVTSFHLPSYCILAIREDHAVSYSWAHFPRSCLSPVDVYLSRLQAFPFCLIPLLTVLYFRCKIFAHIDPSARMLFQPCFPLVPTLPVDLSSFFLPRYSLSQTKLSSFVHYHSSRTFPSSILPILIVYITSII